MGLRTAGERPPSTLAVAADLTVEGPGLQGRLLGRGAELQLRLTSFGGRPASRGGLRSGAAVLERAGLRLTVIDERGRRIASAGRDVWSPLGRAIVGTPRVRLSWRAIVRSVRARRTG